MLPLWGFSDGARVYTGRLGFGVDSCTIGLAATVVTLWVTVVRAALSVGAIVFWGLAHSAHSQIWRRF